MSAPPVLPLGVGQQGILQLDLAGVRKSGPSRVAELEGDVVWVAVPPGIVRVVLPGGAALLDTARVMDARYLITGKIVASRTEPEPSLALRVNDVKREQNREYVRVPAVVDLEATGPGPDGTPCRFKVTTIDISAAGMLVVSELPLSEGAEIEVAFRLPQQSQVQPLRARVARLARRPEIDDPRCELGVAFVDIPPTLHEQLIRFVMQVQLNMRRKGMV
jgi:hypothetical protein